MNSTRKAALQKARKILRRPLNLSEKILFSHLKDPDRFHGDEDFLSLVPGRILMQDATAQMALLQFMLTGRSQSAVPATVHCDHLIIAKEGLEKDMKAALHSNQEVFDFLASASSRCNIGFWGPGSGIIHQVVLENYAAPGELFIGTDSHTPNAGGLGALAVGVGGADAVDVMAGLPWQLRRPQILGVHLKGRLSGWASPKDVILYLLDKLTVKGGTNKIVEYFGEGASSLSCTGKATIANMGAELGATASLFPFDLSMQRYLEGCRRPQEARAAAENEEFLKADPADPPESLYDEAIEIDLSKLRPLVSGPHSPDRVRPIKDLKREIKEEGWPQRLSAALIGSCTNSSYEDMGRSAHVARQARAKGLSMPQPFLITPGSLRIKKTIARHGLLDDLKASGALVLANACGPCIGQWNRGGASGQPNVILNSFNRNFKGRNDGSARTLSFIASPEAVMAMGFSGRLDFNPETDSLKDGSGGSFRFEPPQAAALPEGGFAEGREGFREPKGPQAPMVQISASSERLQKLEPFPPWDGQDMEDMPVLCKARGKCTTDHICPAGFWLKYRGHLDKISDNLLTHAVNDWTGEPGRGKNLLTGQRAPFAQIARSYKAKDVGWVIVGDENYGEGSSREHAAMTPRHLGAKAVIAKSFARIHETNLKRQGVLPMAFKNPSDYDKIKEESRLSIKGLEGLKPKSEHVLEIRTGHGGRAGSAGGGGAGLRSNGGDGAGSKSGGNSGNGAAAGHSAASNGGNGAASGNESIEKALLKHSLSADQIEWLRAGSSLNFICRQGGAKAPPGAKPPPAMEKTQGL